MKELIEKYERLLAMAKARRDSIVMVLEKTNSRVVRRQFVHYECMVKCYENMLADLRVLPLAG